MFCVDFFGPNFFLRASSNPHLFGHWGTAVLPNCGWRDRGGRIQDGGQFGKDKRGPQSFSREFRPEKLFPIPIGKQIRIWPNDGNQPFFERQVLTPVWFLRHFAGRLCMPGTRHFSATNQGTNEDLPLNLDGQLSTPPMMWNSPLSNSKLLWDWLFFSRQISVLL